MLCRSTRSDHRVSLSEALITGLAPDGGLFVPVALPRIGIPLSGRDGVAATAVGLLAPFFAGDPLEDQLEAICYEALDIEVPLVPIDDSTLLMELFHGPSAAFKDFGARFLASCMSRIQSGEDRPLTILVATSGDTGGAVAAAFDGKPGVEVVVLYPKGRVSERQAHQLSCWGDNITTFCVDGDFDACQALVKAAFVDPECRSVRQLSSANSINIGRLLPQMAYHAASALQYPGYASVIPTGNLGNALAALWARRVGMPIGEIMLATNANDTLPRLQQTGKLEPHPTRSTLANAMDVSRPSNLERLLDLDGPTWDGLRAVSVDDDTIRAGIAASAALPSGPVCPHTAAALHARQGVDTPAIVAATAHPAKFDTVVEPLIGGELPVPPVLAELLTRPRAELEVPAELDALRAVLTR